METAREGNTVTIIARVTPPGAYEYHFQASTLEKPGALNWTTLHPYSTDNTAKMTVANGQTYLLVVWTRPVGSVLPCEAGTFKVFKATGLEAAPVPDPLANRPWFEHRTKAFRFHVAEGWNADYDDERANDYVINDKQTLAILIVKKVDDLGGKDGAAMLAELEKKWTERLKQSHVEHLTLDGEPAILISAFNEEKKKGMLWQLYVAHAGKLYDIGIVDPNATEFIRDAPAETVTMLKTWDFTP
ncbi:MAG: hypothetical protein BWY76_03073 [bacterium ADurb.Bin429]|nr:MAG: hypothetical protein BWY76_03073 [bacterium ADurb.Bin429]